MNRLPAVNVNVVPAVTPPVPSGLGMVVVVDRNAPASRCAFAGRTGRYTRFQMRRFRSLRANGKVSSPMRPLLRV